MRPLIPSTLIAAALVAGCEDADRPDPPSQSDLERCEGQNLGDPDFDWTCCAVWVQECEANGDDGCDWICNG